jgi:hypothetical protein
MPTRTQPPVAAWEQARWVAILDRMEHRQPDVGLRFWGPPLWLEVTMAGPDSDRWSTPTGEVTAWDWQSNVACAEVGRLLDEHAGDDALLAASARYTIENLILNAVHEIGEWLRLDGERVFPPHLPATAAPVEGDQGNGIVRVHVRSGPQEARRRAPIDGVGAATQEQLLDRLGRAVPASGWSYLPDTTIAYTAAGPLVSGPSDAASAPLWHATWSASTLDASGDDDRSRLVACVARDVHRALVLREADRICRAFHVDGRPRWTLRTDDDDDDGDGGGDGATSLSVSIDHTDLASANEDWRAG